MSNRKSVDLSDTLKEVIIKMSEGNPGALSVLGLLLEKYKEDLAVSLYRLLMNLDDMNIRGSQIWVGYKDHCKQDLDVFIACVKTRDREMVSVINAECFRPELTYLDTSYNEQAVYSGASFKHTTTLEECL